jgi:hypothetical protein
MKILVLTRSTIICIQNAASKPGKMSGAYESPATGIEIRDSPVAEFGNFLKLLTNPSTLFM